MREITVSRSVLGCSRDVSIREKLATVQAPAEGSYTVGEREVKAASLDDICTAFDVKLPDIIPPERAAAYRKYLGSNEIDWSLALGNKGLASELRRYRSEIIPLVEKMESTGYTETLISGRKILESLVPVKVDPVKVSSLIEAGEPLESFVPSIGGYCDPIRYTHGTKTGRMRIESGPRVLTMSKSSRKVLVSRYPGGRVLSVDFVSLEPRLALFTVGKTSRGDVYDEISRGSGEPRSKVKIATLSFLYGAAATDGVGDRLKRQVREYFKVSELHRRIEECGGSNGYGRPLHVDEDRLLIPHWVQSTAVDICLLGFSSLVKRLRGIADPLFLVHDALFLDVPADNISGLTEIISEGVMVSPYGSFPLSLNGLESHE